MQFEQGHLIEYNKVAITTRMHYIDYGLGILKSSALDSYSQNESFDLAKVYNDLSLAGELAGYEVLERFYEIGSHQGIADTQTYLLQQTTKGSL